MDNRVDGFEGLEPFSRYRIHAVDTENGGTIGVTYSPQECKRGRHDAHRTAHQHAALLPAGLDAEGALEPLAEARKRAIAAARKKAAAKRAAQRAAAKKAQAARAAARKAKPKPRPKPRSQPKPRPKPSQKAKPAQQKKASPKESAGSRVREEIRSEARGQAEEAVTSAPGNDGPSACTGTSNCGVHQNQPDKITGYTPHGLHQAIGRNDGRGVNLEKMVDAVRDPKKVTHKVDERGLQWRFQGKGRGATVVLNEVGRVITTFGKSRGPWSGKRSARPKDMH